MNSKKNRKNPEVSRKGEKHVLKSTKEDFSANGEETTYITRRFLKIMRKTCALPRREKSCRYTGIARKMRHVASVAS